MITISRFFRRQTDITNPSGTSGLDPLRGLQERNERNLLEIFSAATPILEEMAKVKPETWRSMTGLFTALESTFGTGVKAIGQGFLRPRNMLQNQLTNMAEGFLAPVMVGLNNLSNQVESYALQNPTGATWGAVIGGAVLGIIGLYYGGAVTGMWAFQLGSMIGGAIGAAIEGGLIDWGGVGWESSGSWTVDIPDPVPTFQTSAAEGTIPNRIVPLSERPWRYQRLGGYQR